MYYSLRADKQQSTLYQLRTPLEINIANSPQSDSTALKGHFISKSSVLTYGQSPFDGILCGFPISRILFRGPAALWIRPISRTPLKPLGTSHGKPINTLRPKVLVNRTPL